MKKITRKKIGVIIICSVLLIATITGLSAFAISSDKKSEIEAVITESFNSQYYSPIYSPYSVNAAKDRLTDDTLQIEKNLISGYELVRIVGEYENSSRNIPLPELSGNPEYTQKVIYEVIWKVKYSDNVINAGKEAGQNMTDAEYPVLFTMLKTADGWKIADIGN